MRKQQTIGGKDERKIFFIAEIVADITTRKVIFYNIYNALSLFLCSKFTKEVSKVHGE
jgi:hypothetical protein